jgi:hypothetical protein
MQRFLSILPDRFKWSIHNIVAHPISEVLFQLGFSSTANWVHDITVPPSEQG